MNIQQQPDPTRLTTQDLIQLGGDAIHQLARRACGTLASYRLLLGRCLLAMDRSRHHLDYGCCSSIHYATAILGMKPKQARQLRHVATRLEELPGLSHQAVNGLDRCSTPGCVHHLYMEAHHIHHYSMGGPTVPENLITLCTACHRNVHEGHLQIQGQIGNLTFLDRHNRNLERQQQLALADWLDFWIGWTGGEYDSYRCRAA